MLFAAKVTAARATARLSRLAGAGGGTTLPGRVLLALAPDGITRLASGLESGAVVISATNGKTTTAAMLAAILDPPLRVCHNRAGANLASGVASALVAAGDAAVGVFEVDEAALPSVAAQLDPSVLVLGNLFRDQLDRYGELELVGERWSRLAGDLPADRMLVRNGDDPLLGDLNAGRARTLAFGIADPGAGLAEMPHAADSKWCRRCGHRLRYETVFLGHLGDWRCPNCDARRPQLEVAAAALELDGLRGSSFDLHTPLGTGRVQLPVPGVYNLYNALAASAAACATGTVSLDRIVSGLERFNPPFGRFERLRIDHAEATLLLVKNPAGANEVIRTLRRDPHPKRLLIALNDRIADGRDVSWIWDVDFELLTAQQESIVTTGTRAAEMALRLKHAGADEARMTVVPALADAVAAIAREPGPVYVLATYTAMLELRRNLAERGIVRPYWEAA